MDGNTAVGMAVVVALLALVADSTEALVIEDNSLVIENSLVRDSA